MAVSKSLDVGAKMADGLWFHGCCRLQRLGSVPSLSEGKPGWEHCSWEHPVGCPRRPAACWEHWLPSSPQVPRGCGCSPAALHC